MNTTSYTPEGVFEARGEINEAGLERYEPQSLPVVAPHRGSLTVQQIVYPNVVEAGCDDHLRRPAPPRR